MKGLELIKKDFGYITPGSGGGESGLCAMKTGGIDWMGLPRPSYTPWG